MYSSYAIQGTGCSMQMCKLDYFGSDLAGECGTSAATSVTVAALSATVANVRCPLFNHCTCSCCLDRMQMPLSCFWHACVYLQCCCLQECCLPATSGKCNF